MSIGLVVAGMVGLGIAVQVAVLGRSSATVNPLSVSLALQVAGVIGGAVWATVRTEWHAVIGAVAHWWWIPLGVGGWVVVAALGHASSRIGVAATLAVSVGAQIVVGLTIDTALGARTLNVVSIVGACLIVAGVTAVATAS